MTDHTSVLGLPVGAVPTLSATLLAYPYCPLARITAAMSSSVIGHYRALRQADGHVCDERVL